MNIHKLNLGPVSASQFFRLITIGSLVYLLACAGTKQEAGNNLYKSAVVAQSEGSNLEAATLLEQHLKVFPDDYKALVNLGVLKHQAKLYNEAVSLYKRALAKKPGDFAALNNLGRAYLDLGRTNDAVSTLTLAIRSKPTDSEAHYNLGVAANRSGSVELAISSLKKALALQPSHSLSMVALGDIYLSRNNLIQAKDLFTRCLQQNSNTVNCQYGLGAVEFVEGKNYDAAISRLKGALAIEPRHARARSLLGQIYLKQGSLDKAVSTWKQSDRSPGKKSETYSISQNSKVPQITSYQSTADQQSAGVRNSELQKAAAQLKSGQYGDAIITYSKLAREFKDRSSLFHNLGFAYAKLGRIADAVVSFQTALSINPNDGLTHYNLGLAYENQAELNSALKHYQESLKLLPSFSNTSLGLARVFIKQGKLEEADSLLARTEKLSSTEDLLNDKGVIAFLSGRTEEARATFREAVNRNSLNSAANFNLGLVELKLKNIEAALRAFKKSLDLDNNSEARLNLGYCYALTDRSEDAKVQWVALTNDPDLSAEALNNLGALELTLGNLNDAKEYFQKALNRKPTLKEAQLNQGEILIQEERFDEAITSYQAVLAKDPASIIALSALADLSLIKGDAAGALLYVQREIAAGSNNPKVYYNLGIANHMLGNRSEALLAYEHFIKVASGQGAYADLLEQAEKARYSLGGY